MSAVPRMARDALAVLAGIERLTSGAHLAARRKYR
jgi:hypothetical protein